MVTTKNLVNSMHKGRVEWAKEEQKSYEISKNLSQKYTHVFISKTPSEYKLASTIIEDFSKKYSMEFDTLFKLYKLQNYYVDVKYFKGSGYKYKTLSTYKSFINRLTTNNVKASAYSNYSFNTVEEFIKEIQKISKPFPLVYDDIKSRKTYSVNCLITSGVLTQEEKDFVQSEIKVKTLKKEKKEMKKFKRTMYSTEQKKILYGTIVNHYSQGLKSVSSLLSKSLGVKVNPKTLQNYILTCKRLEQGKSVIKTMPTGLIQLWKETYQPKNIVARTSKNSILTHLSSEQTEKYIIVDSNNTIVMTSNNVEYVRGFRDCATSKNTHSDWKIYKIELVEA